MDKTLEIAIYNNRVKIIKPLSNIIFSEAYGIIKDPFGVQIQLIYDKRLT